MTDELNTTPADTGPVAKADTVDAWAARASHSVVLPSATEVEVRLPNLPEMMQAGVIPNELLAVAVKVETKDEVKTEDLEALADFHRFLVSKTLVSPEVAPEDVPKLPVEDVQFIVEIATRQRDTDALGRHLAGLERTAEFQAFRDQSLELARLLGGNGLG